MDVSDIMKISDLQYSLSVLMDELGDINVYLSASGVFVPMQMGSLLPVKTETAIDLVICPSPPKIKRRGAEVE